MKLKGSTLAAGAVVLAMALTACASSNSLEVLSTEDEPGTTEIVQLNVGVSPTISGTGFHAALEGGYFADEGLEIVTTTMQSGSQAIPLLLNGEVQVSIVDVPGTALAVEKNLPIRIFASATHTPADRESNDAILVRSDSDIASPKELEGRTVAVSSLVSSPALFLLAGVEADGGDSDEVNLVEVPQVGTVDAILNGTVDAAIVTEPFISQAKAAGLKVLAHPGRDAAGGALQSGYASTIEYLESSPDVIKRFASALERGNADLEESINSDGQLMRDLVVATTTLDAETVKIMLMPEYRSGPIDPKSVDIMLELLYERGFIKEPLTSAEILWNNG